MKSLGLFAFLLVLLLPLYQVQNGNFIYFCDACEVFFVKEKNGKLCYEKQEKTNFSVDDFAKTEGVILKFAKNTMSEILRDLKIKVIKKELVEGVEITQGYTDLYSDFVYVNGKQSNVQIAETIDAIVVGLPVIYSGF